MSTKRLGIQLRPGAEPRADAWVGEGTPPAPPLAAAPPPAVKRLTIDLPAPLHRRLKIKAATEGVQMVDLVRQWIETGCS